MPCFVFRSPVRVRSSPLWLSPSRPTYLVCQLWLLSRPRVVPCTVFNCVLLSPFASRLDAAMIRSGVCIECIEAFVVVLCSTSHARLSAVSAVTLSTRRSLDSPPGALWPYAFPCGFFRRYYCLFVE